MLYIHRMKNHLTFNRYFLLSLLAGCLLFSQQTKAQTETIRTGSFIINMGATNPNTIANGLKPYGLIYDLLRNHNIPVKWVIGAGKIKDGVDFTHNGVQYKGGTFIIPAEFRNAAVNAKIVYWTGLGVVGTNTLSPFTVTITQTFKSSPRWTLDAQNGSIAEGYLVNAGITNTAFPGAYNWKSPQTLGPCDDLFAMPHADPTWATHSNLFFWNQNSKGSIWAACHAVSALENCINPANSAQQMNFLSTRTAATTPLPYPNNSLTLWNNHASGSAPFTHLLFDDPVAQYLGTTDAAMQNGSEQIYLPKQDPAPNKTRWNPGVKVIAYDPTQADVTAPNLANGNIAAVMLYGRGFDDPDRGYVMYEAGHSHNKGSGADVAAQRAFFNFSLFQAQLKTPVVGISGLISGQNINSGSVSPFSVLATSPLSGVSFTYLWSSSCGGSFSNPTAAATNFTAPVVAGPTPCVITCLVTDNCGRSSFATYAVIILSGPLPPLPNPDAASISVSCGTGTPVTKNVLTNDTDPGGLPLTLTNVTGAVNGTASFTPDGTIIFTPNANFTGPMVLTYTVCNNSSPVPLCANSTFTITSTGGTTPATANDAFTITEDVSGTFNVLANDAGGLTVIGITSGPANGRVSINTDNTITYVPNADYAGTDNFTYRVTNGSGGYNTATVTVTITNDGCDSGTYQNGYPAAGGTLTFTPSADTWLNENQTGRNYGSCTTLQIDRETNDKNRALLKFDLSSIPVGATVTSVTLRMQATAVQTNTSFSIDAHSVSNAWSEGTLCDANGNSNWNNRTASPWTAAGGDYSGTILSSVAVTTTGSYTWPSGANFVSAVQGWVNIPSGNNGLLLKFNNEAAGNNQEKKFSSATGTSAPELTVTYTTTNGIGNVMATNQGDNILWSPDTKNYGACNTSDIGGVSNKGRLASNFTFSGIPAGSTITSSTLSMKLQTAANNTQAISVYRLTRAFTEGTGGCGGSANGVPSNWTTASTGNPWTTAGGDFTGNTGSTPYTSTTINNGTAIGTTINWDVASLVQQWQDGTFSNFGFLLKGPETGGGNPYINFHSADATNSGDRPGLNIFYSAPPTCSPIPTRAPLAMPDTAITPNGVALNITTATNDYYPVAGARTYSIVTPPVSGSASINASTGVITYTPATSFNGVRSLTYQVTHTGSGLSDIATVYINITNGPIDAVNDDALPGANSGVVQTINVKVNDTDPEGLVATSAVAITTSPLRGTASVNGSGDIVYTPNAGYTGKDTLFYSLTEPAPGCGSPLSDTARLIITILNRVPTANPDNKTILPCYSNTFNLLANDTDPENGNLTVTNLSAVNPGGTGTLINNNDGTVTFIPAFGLGPLPAVITFTYTVTDNGIVPQVSAPATVTITVVNPPNTAPIAVNDVENIIMDRPLYASVRDNDSDPENHPLTKPTITVAPLHGIAVVNPANGQIVYTPNPGYFGTDVLTYQICDIPVGDPSICLFVNGLCATATLTITIEAPNTVIAINDENSTWINMPVSGLTLTNDYDLQGDLPLVFRGFIIGGLQYSSGTQIVSGTNLSGAPVVNAGTLNINVSGSYTYTPANNFTGKINVPYVLEDSNPNAANDTANLQITVTPLRGSANSVIANNDENTSYGSPVNGNVKTNDSDPQNNTFNVTAFVYDTDGNGTADGNGTVGVPAILGGVTTAGTPVSNTGSITLNADGTYTFTPANDFTGTAELTYTICDNGSPVACANALLHIDVLPNLNGPANDPPVAGDDFSYTIHNTSVNGNFINNDAEPNSDSVSLNGTTIVPGGAHLLIGVPITTVQGGIIQFYTDGTYTYIPPTGYSGPDYVNYTICDVTATAPQPLCSSAQIHLLVGMPDAPIAVNDVNSTNEDTPVSGNAAVNDTPSGDGGNTWTLIGANGGALHGTVTMNTSGGYTYTPAANYNGTDVFTYQVCDVDGDCSTATVTITINPVVDVPIAVNDENSTWQNVNVNGNVFTNDNNIDNDNPVFGSFLNQTTFGIISSGTIISGIDKTGTTIPNAGTILFDVNGGYTLSPSVTFTGTVKIPYLLCSNGASPKCDTAFLSITVDKYPNVVNSIIANNDENLSYGAVVNSNLLLNDRDPQNHGFAVTGITGGPLGILFTVFGFDPFGNPVTNAGTMRVQSNGNYNYTPAVGFAGSIYMPYTITDVLGATSTAILHIDVLQDLNGPANDPPIAGDDFIYTPFNTPATGNFISNDGEPNNEPVSIFGIQIVPGGLKTPIGLPLTTQKGGTVQFYKDGTYLFTALPGFTGPDYVNYTICDITAVAPSSLCASAQIHFLVGVPLSTLPANGLKATAALQGTIATIKWETESEQNTAYFEVERSLDNTVFTSTGSRIIAAGNSTTKKGYLMDDTITVISQYPVIYYRVKLIDVDGNSKYSNTVLVKNQKFVEITGWPNPFKSYVSVNVTVSQPTFLTIRLTDIGGRTIRTKQQETAKGTSQFTITELDNLANGVYLLDITDKISGNKKVIKFIKER